VFNYLDQAAWHRDVPPVTNNHFDEDGLIGLYCLVEPEHALSRRALLIDASGAGDFSVCRSREAARLAFAISRLADRDVSPCGVDRFPEHYSDYCTFVYTQLLQELGKLIGRLGRSPSASLCDASQRSDPSHGGTQPDILQPRRDAVRHANRPFLPLRKLGADGEPSPAAADRSVSIGGPAIRRGSCPLALRRRRRDHTLLAP
jgi:hypothetical protein